MFIAANNYYWYTLNEYVSTFGGSPEGCMMDDQLDWIEDELERAEDDDTIRYVFLYFQEPVFPNSIHISDVMWWMGDKGVKTYDSDDEDASGNPNFRCPIWQ